MNLLFKTTDFTLSISPLFKNTEGKHTIQFVTKEENSKPVHEVFILDHIDLFRFLIDIFYMHEHSSPFHAIEFEELMRTKAPKVWDIHFYCNETLFKIAS